MYNKNFDEKLKAFDADMLHTNPSVPIGQSDKEVIEQLAKLSPIDYDRERVKQAKLLGIRPSTIDNLVKKVISDLDNSDDPFADVEPWDDSIDPEQLLDDVTAVIQKFIVLDKPFAQASALWIVASWLVDVIHCSPILLINAPERACGKTQLLSILAKLSPRSVQASGITPSVLFRMIEKYQPTLFVDEIETVLKDNEELRGLINAGHTRDSAYVWRSVASGDDFEPKRFSVWGMKAIAGINAIKLAETVTSRSIVIELRRKKPEESVQRLRNVEIGLLEELQAKLARFQADYSTIIKKTKPELPNWLGDREQDNWEPLFQVATIAGDRWLADSYECAKVLTEKSDDNKSVGSELLEDIQEILQAKGWIKISLAELLKELCADVEKAWATYNRGDSIKTRQLSKKLADYGIVSRTIRANDNKPAKGFEASQFNDAFERYLSSTQKINDSSYKPLNSRPSLDVAVTNDVTNSNLPSNSNRSVTQQVTTNINEIILLNGNVTQNATLDPTPKEIIRGSEVGNNYVSF
jgi:putative DNA primase/helicase